MNKLLVILSVVVIGLVYLTYVQNSVEKFEMPKLRIPDCLGKGDSACVNSKHGPKCSKLGFCMHPKEDKKH